MAIDYAHEHDLAEEFRLGHEAGRKAGREDMLREVLAEADAFEAKMRKRRYFNNAAGVGRFRDHLNAKLNDVLLFPKG